MTPALGCFSCHGALGLQRKRLAWGSAPSQLCHISACVASRQLAPRQVSSQASSHRSAKCSEKPRDSASPLLTLLLPQMLSAVCKPRSKRRAADPVSSAPLWLPSHPAAPKAWCPHEFSSQVGARVRISSQVGAWPLDADHLHY